ncbi:MAG: hypothetical protein GY845_25935 [Planctomycetes bacterium]|nr:hypothetical protein [Planctomycetota bacterium]
MSVVPTTWIASSSSPTSLYNIWLPYIFFPHDWAEPLELSTTYTSDIQTAGSMAEDRRIFTDRPRRVVSMFLFSCDIDETLLLEDVARRLEVSGYPTPLYCDVTELTQTSTLSVLNCDTTYRRFFDDARILILNDDGSYEVKDIDSKTDSTITLKTNMASTKGAGTQIMPLIECDMSFSSGGVFATGRKILLPLTMLESVGQQGLSATVAPYSTEPTFAWQFNAVSNIDYSVDRLGESVKKGNRQKYYASGDKGVSKYSGTLTFFNRADYWEFLEFFDSCRGSLYPFWMMSPAEEFQYVSHTTTTISVNAVGEESDWAVRPNIAMRTVDGDVYVREITAIARGGGVDELTFTDVLPSISASDVEKISLGMEARFENGEITEQWLTGNHCNVTMNIVEVQEEKTVDSDVKPMIPGL